MILRVLTDEELSNAREYLDTGIQRDSDRLIVSVVPNLARCLLATIVDRDEQLVLARGAYDNLEMTCGALRLNQAQTDEEIKQLRAEIAAMRQLLAIPDAKANYAWRAIKGEQRVEQLEKALREIAACDDDGNGCGYTHKEWRIARAALEAKP
jgi:hypothetical protein